MQVSIKCTRGFSVKLVFLGARWGGAAEGQAFIFCDVLNHIQKNLATENFETIA